MIDRKYIFHFEGPHPYSITRWKTGQAAQTDYWYPVGEDYLVLGTGFPDKDFIFTALRNAMDVACAK